MISKISRKDLLCDVVMEIAGTPINPPILETPDLYLEVHTSFPQSGQAAVSAVLIYIQSAKKTYHLDIAKLGADTFTIPCRTGYTLRNVLESPAFPKVFFDIRNASAALFSAHGIRVAGVRDLQLFELASRFGAQRPGRFVANLRRCVESDLPARAGKWDEKVRDPAVLAELWGPYSRRPHSKECAGGFWRMVIVEETLARIQKSQDMHYDAQAPGMQNSPWDPDTLNERSTEMTLEMLDDLRIGDEWAEIGYGIWSIV